VTLSVAAVGRIAAGRAVLRRGARPGDRVYVSGTLGDAALGVIAAKGGDLGVTPQERAFLIDRFRLPQPRVAVGPRLVGVATAMMDVSDGLVADLGHICSVSGVAAVIEAERLPLSPAARAALACDPARLDLVLGGGDDYELLFTADPSAESRLTELSCALQVPLTPIGSIETGHGVRVIGGDGRELTVKVRGYEHF
jgi:thiamine-monophosphate kinase